MVASCVALNTLLTSPHEMAAHKYGARKDGTTGGVLASESRESQHALYSKMAASWGSAATAGLIFCTMDRRVRRGSLHLITPLEKQRCTFCEQNKSIKSNEGIFVMNSYKTI